MIKVFADDLDIDTNKLFNIFAEEIEKQVNWFIQSIADNDTFVEIYDFDPAGTISAVITADDDYENIIRSKATLSDLILKILKFDKPIAEQWALEFERAAKDIRDAL